MTNSKFILIICILSLTFLINSETIKESETPSPIILIPGDGGSRGHSDIDFYFITLKNVPIWINYFYMVFPQFLKNIFSLKYDPITHRTFDFNGSKVHFPGWGSTEMIEELDGIHHKKTTYFYPLVENLIRNKYYKRNKTIRGAPYDFRKAPNENEDFIFNLKKLVEETYEISGRKRIVLLGHSMGSLYSLYFLKRMAIDWKKKYIRTFISVSGPLGGAVQAVQLETSGLSLGSPRSSLHFRDMQRSFPSSAFLLPRMDTFGNKPLIMTLKRNYSSYDYEAFFHDMKMPYGYMMYKDNENLVNASIAPEGIDEIYCIYGHGLKTVEQLLFSNFPNGKPCIVDGNGDGTVNLISLEICKKWKNVQLYPIKDAGHLQILGNSQFIWKIKQILLGGTDFKSNIKPYQRYNKTYFSG